VCKANVDLFDGFLPIYRVSLLLANKVEHRLFAGIVHALSPFLCVSLKFANLITVIFNFNRSKKFGLFSQFFYVFPAGGKVFCGMLWPGVQPAVAVCGGALRGRV
jgi:hypothetical protein